VLATWPVAAAGWALAAEQFSCAPVEAFHLAPLRKRARPFAFGRQGLKPLGVLVISSFSLMQLRVDENQIRSR
jgi:hypothetical protein